MRKLNTINFIGEIRTSNRPNCNSILHLFGGWLFEAAFIGNEDVQAKAIKQDSETISTTSLKSDKSIEVPPGLSPAKFELGKAEAVGALCRIFCNKKTSEEISPLYLARFYLALQKGLYVVKGKQVSDTLGSIIVNATELFRVNLEGVNIVLPQFVAALEAILPGDSSRIQFTSVSSAEVRRSAIQILLSILPLPLHFKVIKKSCVY